MVITSRHLPASPSLECFHFLYIIVAVCVEEGGGGWRERSGARERTRGDTVNAYSQLTKNVGKTLAQRYILFVKTL